jgi:uncharacterized repeat protein (TIGR01451 family)
MSYIKDHKWSFLISLLAIIVIAIVAWFVFKKPAASSPSGSNVSVTIDAPQQVGSGTQAVYKVTVADNESAGMQNVQLQMLYPNGFSFQDSTPSPSALDGTEFNVPNLNPGQNAVIMIKGTLVGNAGETKQISAIAHYQFTNFNAQFVSQGQARSQITNSNVALNFDGPTTTSIGQSVTYTVSYTNTTTQAINNLTLLLTLPTGFAVTSSSPQLPITNSLTIASLAANQSATVTINGSFTQSTNGAQQSFAAEMDGPDPASGQILALANSAYQVSITQAPLELTATLTDDSSNSNNSSGNSGAASNVVNPGDNLSYDIHYQNNGSVAATGVVVTATISGAAANLSSVSAQSASIQGDQIVWNGSQTSDFVSLAPQASGDLKLQFSINNPATRDSSKNLQVQLNLSIKIHEYPQGFLSATTAQKIQTLANISGSTSVATGANPPTVGQNTSYLITFSLSNASNDIQNGVLTIALPNITGFDATSVTPAESSNVSFNPNTRTLTWKVAALAAHAGQFSSARKLQFTETIKPSLTDAGNYMVLGHNISFSGTDTFTNLPVSATNSDLTTNSAGDNGGQVQSAN